MLTKLGKEKTLNLNPNFRLKYGTIDAKDFSSIYLETQAWVQPNCDEINFKNSVAYLKKIAFNSIYNNLDRSIFKDRFIINLDLRTSGMSLKRRSFMCLEVTLYLNQSQSFKSDAIAFNAAKLLTEITADLEKNKFTFKPKKK